MVRDLLTYFNPAVDGQGLEGFLNWANTSMDYWLLPIFLFVLYGLSIYFSTRNEYRVGGQIALNSVIFFVLGMIAQAFTQFNQLVMFIFALGIIVGVVISFIESSRT